MEIIKDNRYKIQEYIINPNWDKGLPKEYFDYRKKWSLTNEGIFHEIPLFLEIESTYACNYRCSMCPRIDSDKFVDKGRMSDELLDILFKQIKKYKIPSIAFSHGGEPTLRKDLPELISRAKKAGMVDTMFHTNGYLLTKELSHKIISKGLTKINFSLDTASVETYNSIRTGGDYERVIKNIFDFIEVRKKLKQSHPRLRVSFVVMPENKHEMDSFYKMWEPHVDVIAFQELIELKPKEYSNVIKLLNEKNYEKKLLCVQLWQLLTIAHNGDVLFCLMDYDRKHVIGNLKKDTLLDCWNSKIMQQARELHKNGEWYKIPLCRECFKMR